MAGIWSVEILKGGAKVVKIVVGFFASMMLFILIATVLRAALRRMMSDAGRAERIACIVALMLAIVFAWFAHGLVVTIIVALYLVGAAVGDYFGDKHIFGKLDKPKA